MSYVFDGGMTHADSMGHERVARGGDAMHVRTGSGMRHSELPAENESCRGLQLWVNLPRAQKSLDPLYADADGAALPTEPTDGATVTTVVGEGSPFDLSTDVRYLDVTVTDVWTWTVPDGWNGFFYVVSGTGTVNGRGLDAGSVAVVEDRASLELSADGDIRAVAVAGDPHDEPIRQRGPFVV